MMHRERRAAKHVLGAAGLTLLCAAVSPAFLPGDGHGPPERDCYIGLAGFAAEGAVPWKRRSVISCHDGQRSCDGDATANGTCVFRVAACVNDPDVPGCDPATRMPRKVVAKGRSKAGRIDLSSGLPSDGRAACTLPMDFPVPLERKRHAFGPGKGKLSLLATKPRDRDRFTFVCLPPVACHAACPPNPDGPDSLTMTVAATGTDLDLGWTGVGHGFAVVPNLHLQLCLEGCDGTAANPTCTIAGHLDETCPGGERPAAPPHPLLAAGVPMCLVHQLADPVTGSANLLTGETDVHLAVQAEVYLTTLSDVCPRCENGRCTAGRYAGKPCTVDAVFPVYASLGNETYRLSSDCPPDGSPAAVVDMDVPLTSGTTVPLIGPDPCGDGGSAVPQEPNACAEACGVECAPGSAACVVLMDDPVNPGALVCADAKGGISQVCCEDDPGRPCFPLEQGGALTRSGRAEPPVPPLPDTTYPKTATGTLAGVFCVRGTGSIADDAVGLPGPAAVLLTGTYEWSDAE